MNQEDLERIVKCVAMSNQGIQFDKKFLLLFDNYELNVKDEGGVFTIKARTKRINKNEE